MLFIVYFFGNETVFKFEKNLAEILAITRSLVIRFQFILPLVSEMYTGWSKSQQTFLNTRGTLSIEREINEYGETGKGVNKKTAENINESSTHLLT